ncbi:MAG TPA: MerR family transcriptional regulator [Candidatus Paceibacterota bacterium]|nr:MerR family transcriptional regulator [Candidatus Paceibacterota bacterium]
MKTGTSISRLAKRFGLSRSTLLYYDRIGLLGANGRTAAGYRCYSAREEKRLRRICELRKAGLTLRSIQVMLGDRPGAKSDVISNRLGEISRQLVSLRHQQRLLASLHKNLSRKPLPPLLDKAGWVDMLRQAGMSENAMLQWHVAFERRAPDEHEQFLASLGIPPDEIKLIRHRSRLGP